MESKEAFDYTIPSGRSESLLVGSSAAVTDGFIRDIEVNARTSPTRIAIEQSSSHVYLVQVLKREFSCQHFILCTVSSFRLLLL